MGIHRLHPNGDPTKPAGHGMVPGDEVSDAEFTTDDKTELIHFAHEDADAGMYSGTWLCAPYRAHFDAYPVDEMMTVLEGSLTITDAEGAEQIFKAGDTFFIAKGTPLTWEITETMRKYFMISE